MFPVLETDRLILRQFTDADALDVFDIFSQEAVTRYHNVARMYSLEQAINLIRRRKRLFVTAQGVRWAIARRDRPERAIGSCGYYALSFGNLSAEIGYDLHPDHWRQGLMTEAVRAMLAWGFDGNFFFSLNRVQALTHPDNTASCRLLTKLGFRREGVLRDYGYWTNRFHDLACYSLLCREWRPRT